MLATSLDDEVDEVDLEDDDDDDDEEDVALRVKFEHEIEL